MGLFAELRRRRVFRTLALYIVGAWGLMQVADVLLPALGLPEESIRYLLFASIAGFPVALVFGWFFDITGNGIHRTRALSDGEAAEPEPLRAADYGLLAALLLVLGLVLYGVVGGVVEIPLPQTASSEQPERAEGPPMVGVLPFEHMGTGEDGEFFASGIHDDLLTRLAKIQSLRVISRTSVLQYAGTTKSIPQIGRELRADAVLEGGVRIAGNQIRINAQLIDARSDEHLWAETFDRELTASNIFEVQAEIARAISAALQATLSESDSAELALIPTSNMAAYRAFHEIMRWAQENSFLTEDRQTYINGLKKAFELDPEFTRPMVEVVAALSADVFFGRGEEDLAYIESLIDRIGSIAPDSADYLSAQSMYFYYVLRDYDRALALIQQAQQRAPSDTRLIDMGSWIQRRLGDFEGSLESGRKAHQLEPNNDRAAAVLVGRLMTMHQYKEALEVSAGIQNPFPRAQWMLMKLELMQHKDLGRYESDLLTVSEEGKKTDPYRYYFTLFEAQLALRDFDDAHRTAATVGLILGEHGRQPGHITQQTELELVAYLAAGDLAAARALALAQTDFPVTEDYRFVKSDEKGENIHNDSLVLLALALGKNTEAAALISGDWNDPSMDRAMWLGRSQLCDVLALATAAEEATACVRDLFARPSNSEPFFEPLLPYYDPIRNTPVFREFLDELAAEGWIDQS